MRGGSSGFGARKELARAGPGGVFRSSPERLLGLFLGKENSRGRVREGRGAPEGDIQKRRGEEEGATLGFWSHG